MPRKPRKKSRSGIYHIIIRGINKQVIFKDDKDNMKFLQTLGKFKRTSNFKLYAYCLMKNHIHLLLEEKNEPVSITIQRISSSFVFWYNKRYGRIGHLFQERFRSEPVEDRSYFLTVLRYIHQNPVKAGIVKNASLYKWSSINDYMQSDTILTDTDWALELFSKDKAIAIYKFKQYMNQQNYDRCLDYDKHLLSKDEIKKLIKEQGINNIGELRQLNSTQRNSVLKSLKQKEGVTIRHLSRITGISKSVIHRA